MDDIESFTKHVQQRSDVRHDKTCSRASFGGYLAHFMNTRSHVFQCFVAHAGIFNLIFSGAPPTDSGFEWELGGVPWLNKQVYEELSPSSAVENLTTPTLLLHGQKDFRVDISQSIAAFTTLQRKGIDSRFVYFPDEGHWITKPQNLGYWYEEVNAWLKKFLR